MFSASFLLSSAGAKDQGGCTGSIGACATASLGADEAAMKIEAAATMARTPPDRACDAVRRTVAPIVSSFASWRYRFPTGGAARGVQRTSGSEASVVVRRPAEHALFIRVARLGRARARRLARCRQRMAFIR